MKSALTIKDLVISRPLRASEMAVVHGGLNANGGDIDPGFSPGHPYPPAVTMPTPQVDVAKMIDDVIRQKLDEYRPSKVGTGRPL